MKGNKRNLASTCKKLCPSLVVLFQISEVFKLGTERKSKMRRMRNKARRD
jgi:hypothetical protein